MKVYSTIIVALLFSFSAQAAYSNCSEAWTKIKENGSLKPKYLAHKGKCDIDLKHALQSVARKSSSVSYKQAKKFIFSRIDHHGGKVCSVYSSHCLQSKKVPNHRQMNAEHTWPKSKGANRKPAISDLHHLFPCDSKVNSIRSSYPFCEVGSNPEWTNGLAALGRSGKQGTCFEPPIEHRGNLARSMFYFAIRYNKRIDSAQEKWFRKWNKEDPVDRIEAARNMAISGIQRNTNPFVDHPELIDAISDF